MTRGRVALDGVSSPSNERSLAGRWAVGSLGEVSAALECPMGGRMGPSAHEWSCTTEATEFEARRLRRWLVDLVAQWWPGVGSEERHAMSTVVGELLSNVVRHAPGRLAVLLLDSGDGTCLVAVSDQNSSGPVPRGDGGGEAESGRGLTLIQGLSRSWGWHPIIGGKVVWARLSVSGNDRGAAA
jgi:anti-sigma regulatory factor (Ser/Thr protein kinase)